MGIWDLINSATDALTRNAPDLYSVRDACDYGWTTLSQYLPDDEGRASIVRFATSFARNAAIYGFHLGLSWFPGGIIVYKIVEKALQDQSSSHDSKENMRPDLTLTMEEVQAKMDKMQKELNDIKQKSKIPNQSAEELESLKELPNEPIEGSALKTDPKPIQSAKESEPVKELTNEPIEGSDALKTDPKKFIIQSRL